MLYAFNTGLLIEDRYKFDVKNITLEVVEGEVEKGWVANDCLNGRFNIKGVLDNVCLRNQSKIRKGGMYKLQVNHEKQFSILPVLILNLLDVGFHEDSHFRVYTWMFCGVQRPLHDKIGLLPGSDGLISLDELLLQIGGSRRRMDQEKQGFNAEGGLIKP
jgi:hypothetical protein